MIVGKKNSLLQAAQSLKKNSHYAKGLTQTTDDLCKNMDSKVGALNNACDSKKISIPSGTLMIDQCKALLKEVA
eukprot:3410585-Lingulodinium_polyedra.AAC.1